jgi:hypothetical protein
MKNIPPNIGNTPSKDPINRRKLKERQTNANHMSSGPYAMRGHTQPSLSPTPSM